MSERQLFDSRVHDLVTEAAASYEAALQYMNDLLAIKFVISGRHVDEILSEILPNYKEDTISIVVDMSRTDVPYMEGFQENSTTKWDVPYIEYLYKGNPIGFRPRNLLVEEVQDITAFELLSACIAQDTDMPVLDI